MQASILNESDAAGSKRFSQAWRLLVVALLHCSVNLGMVEAKDLAQYGVRHYDRQDGISASSILEILQTQEGYLWLGTYDGLSRFNGVEFKVFNQSNSPHLHGDNITSLLEASDGTLWVGTLGKGVQGFLDPNLYQVKPHSLMPEASITDLDEDSNGRIYASTRRGLFYFEDNQWKRCSLDLSGEQVGSIQAIAIDRSDRVLMATPNGILVWDGQSCERLDPQLPSNLQVQGFVYHAEKGLWFGTFEGGLYHYQDGSMNHYRVQDGLLHENIGDLSFDSQGQLWIGSREGVSVLREGSFSHYPMKGQMVYSIRHDSEDGIWVGTYLHGLYRLGDARFSSYTNIDRHEVSVIGRAIIDFNDQLLVGTNLGIYELNDGYLHPSERFSQLKGVMIRSMKPAHDGGVWVGTHTAGIFKLWPDGTLQPYGIDEGLGSLTNRCVIESRDGRVWIAGNRGLQLLEAGQIRDVPGLQGFSILSLHELKDGTIAVATDGDGLHLLRPDGHDSFLKADGLSSNIVFYAHEDTCGALWITCSDGGISYLKNGIMHLLSVEDGLPHDSIFYIIDDGNGSFWMACNSGIYQVNSDALRARANGSSEVPNHVQYGRADGITAGGVTGVTHAYIDPHGNLWFPATQGIISVNPAELQEPASPPKVIIESFSTESKAFEDTGDPDIPIAPGTQRFTFSFAGISFRSSDNVQYRVKLEGYDRDYNNIQNRREFAYTNLKPGTYRFVVNAGTRDGLWSESVDSVTFTLKPHLYQQPLFQWLAGLGALILVFGIVWFRIRRSRSLQRLLSEKVEQRTAELRYAMAEAEQANHSKSLFLASVTHEVRNPLNGILGVAELLLETDLSQEQRRKLEIVHSSARSLLIILNDLLDYSKLDSDQLTLESIPFSVRAIIDETLELQEARIQEKALTIGVKLDPQLPDTVVGDPLRHRQVLHNLISNAVKFTEAGQITIRVALEPKIGPGIIVKFSVKDTGIGIPKPAQRRLFQAYQQAEASTARTHGGTGLGLAICRSLVERMGGRIWVESEPGKGATFSFTSCLDIPSKQDGAAEGISEQEGNGILAPIREALKVLVVDDENINLEIARVIFSKLGLQIDCALGAREAISKLGSTHYDILFVDYIMPETDGATLTQHIRSQRIATRNPNLTIVAITGATARPDHERLKSSGVDHIIEKPLLPGPLRSLIVRHPPMQITPTRDNPAE